MNVLDLAHRRVKLRKVSSTNGGEYQGPCPGCGGDDRFHVWPVQNEGQGAYWCRGCGKAGDAIQFLRDFEGKSFRDACAELRITMPDDPGQTAMRPIPPQVKTRPEFQPTQIAPPVDLWQEHADKLISWAADNLKQEVSTLEWLERRGIPKSAAADYRLGWNPGENGKDLYRSRKAWGLPEIIKEDGRPKSLWIPRGLVIPWIESGVVHRVRIRRLEADPRYYVLPGSSMATMILEPARRAFVVVESELDAIAVVAANKKAGAVALGSVSAKPDSRTFEILQAALQILNALDYDEAGAKAMTWWNEQFQRCDRWPVPKGKDPGEAVAMGIDLNRWIQAGLPPVFTIFDPAPQRPVSPKVQSTKIHQVDASPETYGDDVPEAVRELHAILKKNRAVKIINTPNRYTVLRNGKFVGGRINELVFRHPSVMEYIMRNPDEEIDAENLIIRGN